MSPGVYLLQQRLVHSHSCFEACLFHHGLLHEPQCLQRYTHSSVALTTTTVFSEVNLVQHSTYSVMDLSIATHFEVHQHELIQSHRCFEECLLQSGLSLGSQSLQRYTCYCIDVTTATDTWRCTCSGVGLSMATDGLGCTAPAWTHPQVIVPLNRIQTGVLAFSVQQHKTSSNALAICQPRCITIAVIFPGTAEEDNKQ